MNETSFTSYDRELLKGMCIESDTAAEAHTLVRSLRLSIARLAYDARVHKMRAENWRVIAVLLGATLLVDLLSR